MRKRNRRGERGVSLLLAILALMVLTAIAAGMMFMSSTETSINSNFKAEETAYFAARAGVEEVRDRMLATHTSTVSALLPTQLPAAGGKVLYVLQNGVTAANVTSISSSNPMGDDELCHDFSFGGMTSTPANVRCTTLPSGSGWYVTTPSVAPFPLEYKWIRVTLKANSSAPYTVDSSQPVGSQVCWNGISEVALPTGTAACTNLIPGALPVYMVTAMAVTPSGARRIVQQELAQTPTSSNLPGGLFATGPGCVALDMAGGANTGSFNSNTAGTPTNPPSNVVSANGNVGANGSVNVGGTSTQINGSIATNLPASIGTCPTSGVSKTGNPGMGPLVNLPSPYVPPVPPLPNPLPPTSNVTYNNTTLTAGAYGNITFKGNVTLTGGTTANPAVYNVNSFNFNGNANVTITGPVVINIAGVGQSTVVNMTGGTFANNTYVPSNFTINYGGTGNMAISGGTAAYAVINAPKAAISFHGGSNFYGQAIGYTIDNQGGTNFYWDMAANSSVVTGSGSFYEISLRELSY